MTCGAITSAQVMTLRQNRIVYMITIVIIIVIIISHHYLILKHLTSATTKS